MRLIRSLFTLMFLTVWGYSQKAPPELYVFLPSEIRPHAMKLVLADAFPDFNVTVFPRFRDFYKKVKEAKPNAFMTLAPIAESLDYQGALLGERSGAKQEPYVLLSENRIDPDKMDGLAIGVVDLLGRRNMPEFVTSKLGGDKNLDVKTVTKLEDLLSMLSFNYVDAIFVPQSKVEYYMERTKLKLVRTDLADVVIGLPVVAVLDQEPETMDMLKQSLDQLKKELNEKLGVDRWVLN